MEEAYRGMPRQATATTDERIVGGSATPPPTSTRMRIAGRVASVCRRIRDLTPTSMSLEEEARRGEDSDRMPSSPPRRHRRARGGGAMWGGLHKATVDSATP
jgi:hypothetical protein